MKRALIHLRLPFSVVLAPLFFWGIYLSGARPSLAGAGAGAAFAVVHVLLYGGMNAFNSYYDRDDGPIGALADPPPVDCLVLGVSLLCKALALVGGFAVSPIFGTLVAVAVSLSVLYSHGRFRWKERPLLAGVTIFVGQGLLGVLWGMAAAGAPLWPLTPLQVTGILGAALFATGFYPLTGVYQIAADAERGSQTLAVRLGVEGCFRFGFGVTAAGGAAIGIVLLQQREFTLCAAAGLYGCWALAGALRWRGRIPFQTARASQRELMRLAYANGLFFSTIFLMLLIP